MSEATQRIVLDPVLAAAFFALAAGGAWILRGLLDRFTVAAHPANSASQKLASLEGLRGILAFSVVAHHACCWYHFSQSGLWSTGSSILFDRLASFGVIQFFYLSGFLFWRKLIQRGGISAGRFYLSRFLRIGPVYYASVAAAITLGCLTAGSHFQVRIGNFLASLLPWLFFSIGGRPDVNHADILRITCGVTWTLALEWLFYLSLPFLAWFSRKAWRLALYAVAFGVLFLLARQMRTISVDTSIPYAVAFAAAQFAKFMLIGFGGGMLVATTEAPLRRWLRGDSRFFNVLVVVCFLAYLNVPGIEDFGQILLLAAFALIVHGADIFGLLTNRAVRFMGAISYPVYLLHGMVFYAAMLLRGGMHAVAPAAYLAQTAVCVIGILILATTFHLLVERPTMNLSERIARSAAMPQIVTS